MARLWPWVGGAALDSNHAEFHEEIPLTERNHFLTFSCYRREPLLDDALRAYFLLSLERLRARHRFTVFGYVLMPEHVHLLVSEPRQIGLSKVVGSLKTAVSRRSPQQQSLWQRRYYDFNVLNPCEVRGKATAHASQSCSTRPGRKPEQYR